MTSKGFGPRGPIALAGLAFALASAGAPAAPTQVHADGKGVKPKAATVAAPSSPAPHAPSGFVENVGQWDAQARFMARAQGMTMWLKGSGLVLDYAAPKGAKAKFAGHAVEMAFVGGQKPTMKGLSPRGGAMYISGKHERKAARFERVLSQGIYKGVDFVTYLDEETPRYDFVVAPGADPKAIRLAFKGAKSLRVVNGSTLGVGTVFGEQKMGGLFAYQTIAGQRVSVPVSFVKNTSGDVSFALGGYDRKLPLVIDPLVYGTYFGGNAGFDEVRAITTDSTGGTYVTGYTLSAQFPINYGPYGFNLTGGRDAFFSKLQGDAYANDYSVYIGGSGTDQGNFLNVDASGNVWILGFTNSPDFPGTGTAPGQRGPMWLMRFAPNSSTVLSPFFGGNGAPVIYRFGSTTVNGQVEDVVDHAVGLGIPKPTGVANASPTRLVIGLSGNGDRYDEIAAPQTGELSAASYLTIDYDNAANTFTVNQSRSGFVPSRGNTFLDISGLVVDREGFVYMSGSLFAGDNTDTAQANPVYDTSASVYMDGRLQRKSDIWIRKLNASGAATPTTANPLQGVVYSSLLGGSSDDFTNGYLPTRNFDSNQNEILDYTGPTIAADNAGNAYILGEAASFDFPRTRGVVGPVFSATFSNISLTKISSSGNAILYSTALAINGARICSGISVDPRGQAYITGTVSRRQTFNVTIGDPPVPNGADTVVGNIFISDDAIRKTYDSPAPPAAKTDDGFLLVVNADATAYIHGTYIGGILDDGVFAPYTDQFGDTFVYGWTDTRRTYSLFSSAAPPTRTDFILDSNMAPFITRNAFKFVPETINQGQTQTERNVGYGAFVGPGSTAPPPTSPFLLFGQTRNAAGMTYTFNPRGVDYLRDGFILRYRLSLPLLSSFTLNPSIVPGGDPTGTGNPTSTTGTLTLSAPAPEGGAGVQLVISNGTYASFDPNSTVTTTTVQVPAGETMVSFPIYSRFTLDQQNVQIRADYSGNVQVATLTVRPWLRSLSISPTTVVGGTVATGAVRLEAPAPSPGVPVSLSTNNTDVIGFDTNPIIVPTDAQTATFQYIAKPVDVATQVQITAGLLLVERTQLITVLPATLNRIEFSPTSVAAGSSVQGTVFLNGRTKSARTIRLSIPGNPAGYTLTPNVITIPAGGDRATFSLQTGPEEGTVSRTVQAVQVVNIGTPQEAVVDGPVSSLLTVTAASVGSITATPSPVASGGTIDVTVTLTNPAPVGGVFVTFTSSSPQIIPFGGTVLFPEGTQTQTFPGIKIGSNLTGADLSVSLNAYRSRTLTGTPKTATVVVLAVTPALTLNPSSVIGGSSSLGRVEIPNALSTPITVQLTSSNSSASVPATVTIPAGQTSVTFPISTTPVAATSSATITARIGGGAPVSAVLTIRTVQVVSLTLSPAFIRGGQTTLLTVTLDGPVGSDTVIPLTFSNGSLISFGQVVVPAGQSSVSVRSSPASRVPRTLTTSISASLGGTTATTTLTVQR